MRNALIIFVKTPKPNFSKTRLIDPLSADQAAVFYSACIKDIYLTMKESDIFDLWFAITPEEFDIKLFPVPLKSENYFFQKGEDLGIRMHNAFEFLFKKQYKKVAVIGSDFPHISKTIINKSFNYLDTFDCIIGPSFDGGYYLIALKNLNSTIFKEINWSTEEVYQQTLQRAKIENMTIKNLKKNYDIDSIAEMKLLYRDLRNMDKSLKNFPLNVWQFVQSIKNNYL